MAANELIPPKGFVLDPPEGFVLDPVEQPKEESPLVKFAEEWQKGREEDFPEREAKDVITNAFADALDIPFVITDIAVDKYLKAKEQEGPLKQSLAVLVETGKLAPEIGQFFLQSWSDVITAAEIPGTGLGILPYPEEMRQEAQERIGKHPVFTLLGMLGGGALTKAALARSTKPRGQIEPKPTEKVVEKQMVEKTGEQKVVEKTKARIKEIEGGDKIKAMEEGIEATKDATIQQNRQYIDQYLGLKERPKDLTFEEFVKMEEAKVKEPPKIKQPMGEKPSTTLGYNIEKMHPDIKEHLPILIEEVRAGFNKVRGERLTTKQAVQTSIKKAGTLTDADILTLKRGDVKNATDILAARIYTNNKFLELGDKLNKITEKTSPEAIGNFIGEHKKIMNMYMKTRALGTETGRALYFHRIPISDGQISGMKKYAEAIKKIDPKSGKALDNILKDGGDSPKLRDKVMFWWYNSMLSNPFTDLANITGNASHFAWESTINVISNKPKATVDVIRNYPKFMKNGIREAAKIYKQESGDISKFVSEKDLKRYSIEAKTPLGRFGRGLLPTTRLAMEDALFSSMTKDIRRVLGEHSIAKAEKISIDQVRANMQNILNDPYFKPEGGSAKRYQDLSEYIDKYAEFMTFRTPLKSPVGKGIQNTMWVKPVIPFMRVLANITKVGYKNSPVGFAKMFGKEFKELSKFERQDIARRAVAGTVLYTGIGALMAEGLVEITGSGPENKRDRELWDKMGYKPNHIYYVNDDGAKKGISYQNINPFNVVLAVMGNWQDQYRFGQLKDDDKAFIEKLSYALAGAAATMTDQSFMQGVNAFFDWIKYKDETYIQDFVTKPFIPNIVGFPRNVKEYAEGSKPRYQAEGWYERLKRRVGLYEGLQPAYSAYGGQKESGYERFPFFPSETVNEPMLDMFQERGFSISVPSKRTKIFDEEMTSEQYSKYVRISADKIMARLNKIKARIENLDNEAAQKLIDKVVDQERDNAKREIRRTIINK